MKDEKQIWQKNRMELLRDYDCSDEGLSTAEAEERAKKYGPNELASGPQKSTFRIFLEQFADFLVIILILVRILVLIAVLILVLVIHVCILQMIFAVSSATIV